MILSAQSIRKLCLERGMLDPFMEETRIPLNLGDEVNGDDVLKVSHGLGSCSYSIRLAQDLTLGWISVGEPDNFNLFSTIEFFRMPKNICAVVRDKSTWARRGIAVQNTHIDPGFCGWLTLEISYHGRNRIDIPKGTGIAQIVFEFLDEETELPYKGKYQNQGKEPQEAL